MIHLIKNFHKKHILLLCSLILFAPITHAQNFDPTAGTGWSWYIDPIKTPKQASTPPPNPTTNANARMEKLQEVIQNSLNRAILDPNQDNIAQYIQLQNLMADRSSQFSKVWQQTLLSEPELDFSILQPTNTPGRKFLNEQAQLEQLVALDIVADSTGLFFFFSEDCPVCHRFAPILKQFASRYDIEVIAISLDGGILPDYPQPKFNHNQAEKLSVPVVPAVYAANPTTQTIVPITFGLVTEDILLQRLIEQLIPTEERLVQQQFDTSNQLRIPT